jgi:hypothetical protein
LRYPPFKENYLEKTVVASVATIINKQGEGKLDAIIINKQGEGEKVTTVIV